MGKKQLLEDVQGPMLVDRKNIVTESLPGGMTKTTIPGRLSVCGVVNGNGRRYRTSVWENNIKEDSHLQTLIKNNACFGLLEHPSDGVVTLLSPISHKITEVKLDGVEVHGAIEIIEYGENSPGAKLRALIEHGYNPTVSSRGFGSIYTAEDGVDEVDDDYVCEGWDVVFTPSFKEAVLNPQRESQVEGAKPHDSKALTEALNVTPEKPQRVLFVGESTVLVNPVKDSDSNHVAVFLKGKKIGESFTNDPEKYAKTLSEAQELSDSTLELMRENTEGLASEAIEWYLSGGKGKQWDEEAYLQRRIDSREQAEKADLAVHEYLNGISPADAEAYTAEDWKDLSDKVNTAIQSALEFNGGEPPKQENKEEPTMDKKHIQEAIGSMQQVDPTKLTPKRFAEGASRLESLHKEVAEWAAADPKLSWDAQKLHESISEVESQWEAAAAAPSKKAQELSESYTKLLSVTKAVADRGVSLKKKLGESLKKGDKYKKLAEEITRRGRAWRARAKKLEAQNAKLNRRFKTACETCDTMRDRYQEDVTTLGRRIIEMEFKDKLSDETVQKQLKEAKVPQDIIAIRESLEGSKPTQEGSKPTQEGKDQGKGQPRKPVQESGKPSGSASQPAGVSISESNTRDPRSIAESVDMVRRMSGYKPTSAE